MVEQWGELFASRKNYGWPLVKFEDLADLSRQFGQLGVVGYRIMGSFGLDGFVLASTVEHRRRELPAEFAS